MRRRRSTEAGSAILELTIGFPFMMLLLMGIIDFGRVFYSMVTLQGAAHAGAQRGVTDVAYANNTTAQKQAALKDSHDVSDAVVTAKRYCQCGSGPEVPCSTTCASSSLRVFVQVAATQEFHTLIGYPGIPDPVQLKSTVTLRAK